MSGILAVSALSLFLQDPFQDQIDEAVRRFQAAVEVEQALNILSAELASLGANATSPIARRLAQDLRSGMAADAAPAFIDALVGRPEALVPLQAAFRDATTSVAGRLSLAGALSQLEDSMTWREGLFAIASDGRLPASERQRAAALLHEAGDERGLELLKGEGLPEADPSPSPKAPRRVLAEFPRPPRAEAPPPLKNVETRSTAFLTMPGILAGGVTLVLLVLLGVEILRKGP